MKRTIALLIILSLSQAIAHSRIEHYPITSEILADAGHRNELELTVYLPPGYDDSSLAYPVLYIHHGLAARLTDKNRAMFGGYSTYPEYTAQFRPMQEIADVLIEEGRIGPMILVGPAIEGWISTLEDDPWADYFFEEVIPFVDSNFRTLAGRENQGTLGISKGGNDGPLLAFKRPDLFSVVGISAGATSFNYEQAVESYDPTKYPLLFWLYHGRKDTTVPFSASERLVAFLDEKGWEYEFVTTDGEHLDSFSPPAMTQALEFFSERLGKAQVAVQPQGKLATMWGKLKSHQ